MRKCSFWLITLVMLCVANLTHAAWTLEIIEEGYTAKSSIYRWTIRCTSDGNALSATDILSTTNVIGLSQDMVDKMRSSLPMVLAVIPGTGGVALDTTIDITLGWSGSVAQYSHAAFPATFDVDSSFGNLAEDWEQYFSIGQSLYLTISDIGTSGDQVTLYFEAWVEGKK